jgi:hypothetical protein
MSRRLATMIVFGLIAAPAAATAQTRELSRVEAAVGVLWTGASTVSTRDANETSGAGNTFRLFASRMDLASAPGLEGRLAIRLTPRLQVEGLGSFAKPRLETRIANDFEGAAAARLREQTLQITIQAAANFNLSRSGSGLFLTAGGGYLRQLHEGHTVVATGQSYFGGGGWRVYTGGSESGLFKAVGMRADARAVVQSGGVAPDGGTHIAPAAGVSLFLGF